MYYLFLNTAFQPFWDNYRAAVDTAAVDTVAVDTVAVDTEAVDTDTEVVSHHFSLLFYHKFNRQRECHALQFSWLKNLSFV